MSRRSEQVRVLVLLWVLLPSGTGCSVEALLTQGRPCSAVEPCAPGLSCINGVCRDQPSRDMGLDASDAALDAPRSDAADLRLQEDLPFFDLQLFDFPVFDLPLPDQPPLPDAAPDGPATDFTPPTVCPYSAVISSNTSNISSQLSSKIALGHKLKAFSYSGMYHEVLLQKGGNFKILAFTWPSTAGQAVNTEAANGWVPHSFGIPAGFRAAWLQKGSSYLYRTSSSGSGSNIVSQINADISQGYTPISLHDSISGVSAWLLKGGSYSLVHLTTGSNLVSAVNAAVKAGSVVVAFHDNSSKEVVWLENGGSYQYLYSSWPSSITKLLNGQLVTGWKIVSFHYGSVYNSAWVENGGVYQLWSQSIVSSLLKSLNMQVAVGNKVHSFSGAGSYYVAWLEKACP